MSTPVYRFGWTNASFVYGLGFLNPYMKRALAVCAPYDSLSTTSQNSSQAQQTIGKLESTPGYFNILRENKASLDGVTGQELPN